MELETGDQSRQKAFHHIVDFEIDGIKTDLVCHKFANKVLLIITQYEKITNIYSAKNQTFSDELVNPAKIYDIGQKFGSPSDEVEAAIRFLLNFIKRKEEVIFSLGLKQINRTVLNAIKEELVKISCLSVVE